MHDVIFSFAKHEFKSYLFEVDVGEQVTWIMIKSTVQSQTQYCFNYFFHVFIREILQSRVSPPQHCWNFGSN